ncbi:MAG: alpha/beta hydrolase [Patescibacteria group bacterium]
MKVILMHGKDTDPSQKWYPWFKGEVEKRDVPCIVPILPDAQDPKIEEWVSTLSQTHPDQETVLIGHSRGGVAILRWLEKQPPSVKVRKVILVATNSGFVKNRAIPTETNNGFYSVAGYDFEKIKMHCDDFVVFHSKDDQWVPFVQGDENATGLGARLISFDDKGHFGKGIDTILELLTELEIK